MHGIWAALRAGQVGRGGARVQVDLVLLAADRVDRQRHGAGRHVEHRVHAVLVEPAPGDAGADVGLVLVVGREHLDLDLGVQLGELLRCLPDAGDGERAGVVAVVAGLVVQHPQADRCGLGEGRAGQPRERARQHGDGNAQRSAASDGHRRFLCNGGRPLVARFAAYLSPEHPSWLAHAPMLAGQSHLARLASGSKDLSLRAGFGAAIQGDMDPCSGARPWIAASQALLAMTKRGNDGKGKCDCPAYACANQAGALTFP